MSFTIPFNCTLVGISGGWLDNSGVFVTDDPGAGNELVIEKITLTNNDGSPHTVTLWIGSITDVDLICKDLSVPADSTVVLNETYVIGSGVQMIGKADASNVVAIELHGAKRTDSGTLTRTVTPKMAFQGFLDDGGGDPTLYATPNGNTTGVVHGIAIVNTDTNPHDVALYIGTSADGPRLVYKTLALAAGDRVFVPGPLIVMPVGWGQFETLWGIADTVGVVACYVSIAEHVV